MNMYPRLTEKEKKQAVLMDITGHSAKEIAEHFKRTGATVTHWRQSNWWKELRHYYIKQIEEAQTMFNWESKDNKPQLKD